MEVGEAIWASGARVAALPDVLGDKVGGEEVEVGVKRTHLVEAPLDKAGSGIGGVRDGGGELFIEGYGYFTVTGKGFVLEGNGLIGCDGDVCRIVILGERSIGRCCICVSMTRLCGSMSVC